jgi:glycosyltransferase involved in cell wall biosynthesis
MRIAIDLMVAEKEPGGLLFAARALLEGLARLDQMNEYIIITTHPENYQALAVAPNISIYKVKLRSWKGLLLQHQLLLPDVLQRIRPDVLHAPAFAAPVGWHGPLVVTVHDLGFLKAPARSFSLYTCFYWQYLLRESVRRAKCVIAVSEQTREELISYWSVKSENICLIHNALRSSLDFSKVSTEEIQAIHQRNGERYLLHIGRIIPRKNIGVLVQAFNELAARFDDLHLVLTGGVGQGGKEAVQQIETSPYKERIHMVGWVNDEELSTLYLGAEALVFPSTHEGFGLPIVEAMTCGTPVVASPEAASREVAGEAVVRVNCTDASTLANTIAGVLTDKELRGRLAELGKVQAKMFSIENCAKATLDVYQAAYDANKLQPLSSSPDHVQRSELEKILIRLT